MTGGSVHTNQIAAVVLAGGDGTRLGLGAKAQVTLGGHALIDRALTCLRNQTSMIAISMRRTESWAESRGYPVLHDPVADVGPLAGVLAALTWAHDSLKAAYVLTAPVDCAFLPEDLVERLSAAMTERIEIAVAESAGRTHHLIALWRTQLREQLLSELQGQGAMSVGRFQAQCRTITVSWPVDSRDPFFNINTQDDLAKAEALAQ
jgi:molybdenum cofactor guanylyltransferase